MLSTHQNPAKFLVPLLLLAFCAAAPAQSGRRATKLAATPPPIETAPSRPSSADPTAPARPKTHLLVARQTTEKHLRNEDKVFASFIKRLNEFADIETAAIGDMNQSQARKRARGETEQPVVILTFDIDSYAEGTIILNSQDLEIEYFLFAPRTGKKEIRGKLYFQGVGSGRLRKSDWPNGPPVKLTPEAAGIEAAESLHQWLVFNAARKKTEE